MPMPMGLATHDQVKRQIFVAAPSPHFSWTLTCLLHGNPSNNSINPLALLWLCTNSHSHSHYLGKEHFIALHCLTDWFVTDKSTNVDSFDNFSHQPTTIPEMFVQVRAPVVSAIIDIDFLQTKQRPTGTTGTSKYAGGASILMSWCFAFAKYSRDLYMAKVISWTFSKESSQSKDSVMSKKN